MNQLKELIDSCLADSRFMEGRREVKAETWSHVGCGTERVVDFLLKKYDEIMGVNEES